MEQLTRIQKIPSSRTFPLLSIGSFRKLSGQAKRETVWGLAFLSPWILGFLAFTLIPMVATLIFSFTNIKMTQGIMNPISFAGLDNYRLLLRDSQIWKSLLITIRFGLIALPVGIIVPLGLAILMNSNSLKGRFYFRTLFYMPFVIPFVASIFLWGGMLNPETGWINKTLIWFGVSNPPGWANDVHWVYPAYVLMGIWGIGNAMLITLAGLQGVPTELYDAAKVDGAGWWASLRNITLPMISPVIFFNLTLSVIGLFQYFLVPLVVNQGTGRPGGATMFYNLYLYKTFFTFQNMSYGATQAWLLFLVILIVTVILFGTAKYWVFYAGERS